MLQEVTSIYELPSGSVLATYLEDQIWRTKNIASKVDGTIEAQLVEIQESFRNWKREKHGEYTPMSEDHFDDIVISEWMGFSEMLGEVNRERIISRFEARLKFTLERMEAREFPEVVLSRMRERIERIDQDPFVVMMRAYDQYS